MFFGTPLFEIFSTGVERRNACNSSCKVSFVFARSYMVHVDKFLCNSKIQNMKIGWVPLFFFFYVKTNGTGRHRPFKDYFFLFKAEVLFYKMLVDLRKNVAVWKIPSLHRFACLPRTTWMCNDAEAIRTAWNRSTRGKTYPNTTSSTINIIWTGPGSNPGLNFERPATNRLSYCTAA